MGPDKTRRGEAIQRAIDQGTGSLRNDVETMAELATVSSASGGAGARPTAQADGGESVAVLEPYGFAATPPGQAQALVVAPGTDDENRVTTGLSAPAGRPSTDPGDAAMWTSAGHSFVFDNDGGLLITSKDGSTIDLTGTGAINISAGPAASITINVDALQSVNIGGTPAFALVKDAQNTAAISAAFAAGAAVVGLLGDPLGTNSNLAFAAAGTAYTSAPPAATTKAKGV